MIDGQVKVTGKPSKYFSLTLLFSCLCEDHHGKVKYVRNTEVDSSLLKKMKHEGKAQKSWILQTIPDAVNSEFAGCPN